MLPFLKKDKEAAMSGSVDKITREPDHEVDYDALKVAAEDVMHAFEKKDAGLLAIALRAAFEICDSLPHHEGEHLKGGEG